MMGKTAVGATMEAATEEAESAQIVWVIHHLYIYSHLRHILARLMMAMDQRMTTKMTTSTSKTMAPVAGRDR